LQCRRREGSHLRPNRRILVLCEGLTEYLYAKALQMELPRTIQRSVSVDISLGKQPDPKSLVLEAKRKVSTAKKERNPYEAIWLFFDHDNQPQLREAFELMEKEGFKMAYSSICIEHWFIMHFENCGRAFANGDEAVKYLRKYIPDYHKTKTNAFKVLRDRLEDAIIRVDLLIKKIDEEQRIEQRNPFFTINDFLRYIEGIKEDYKG
jgi:hypothetical protein